MTVVEAMSLDIVVVRIAIIDAVFCVLDDVAISVVAVMEAMGIDIRIFSFRFRHPLLFRHSELPSHVGGFIPYMWFHSLYRDIEPTLAAWPGEELQD
jgi:hypothetical protein